MKKRLSIALFATPLLAAGLLNQADPAAASPRGAPPPPQSRTQPLQHPHTVTLVTGDKVEVGTGTGGRPEARVLHTTATTHTVTMWRRSQDLYVIPDDAVPYLGDRLDLELFNVTKLVADGYDDAHRSALPVIATYPSGFAKAAAAPAGAKVTRSLPSVSGKVLEEPKASAESFWSALTGQGKAPAAQAAPQSRVAKKPVLAGGIGKLWLNGKVRASLDRSVPSIGAPDAWAAGYDGKGVKIAVLDTGIDATHPDFAGRIAAQRNFTDSPDTVDRYGHGTHVASIAAGSGAADAGKYKGVAPAASLLVGKVLNDNGAGSDDQIIAGMQWAADNGAKVVNMSLGQPGGYDQGKSLLSQAVNTISARSGALFVISAGNDGPGAYTVTLPATADAALAVSATAKTDPSLASFSSRGPRGGDYAIKPEISAPGSGIVAARAAGNSLGTPVDTYYQGLSGTSMAAPHVTGAAAILAQRHPDWSGAQLKDALVNYAATTPSIPMASQGGGRLRVPEAVNATVTASPATVSLGYFPIDLQQDAHPQQALTFRNDGDTAVTYDLSATTSRAQNFETGTPDATAGKVTVSPAQVRIPAHGTATATVSADVTASDTGYFAGYVSASTAGETVFDVPVSYTKDIERYKLDVSFIDRTGAPLAGNRGSDLHLLNYDTGKLYWGYVADGTTRWLDVATGAAADRFPRGRYALYSTGLFERHADRSASVMTAVAEPNLMLSADRTLTFDFRKAQPVIRRSPAERSTGRPDATLAEGYARAGAGNGDAIMIEIPTNIPKYALPSATSAPGNFAINFQQVRSQAPVSVRTVGAGGRIVPLTDYLQLGVGAPDSAKSWHRRLGLVEIGTAAPGTIAGMDLRGKAALVSSGGMYTDRDVDAALRQAGAALALYPFTRGPRRAGNSSLVPGAVLDDAEAARLDEQLAAGPVTVDAIAQAFSPYTYQVSDAYPGGLPARLAGDIRAGDLAQVAVSVPQSVTGQAGRQAQFCRAAPAAVTTPQVRTSGLCLMTEFGRQRTDYVQPGGVAHTSFYGRDPDNTWISGTTPMLAAGLRTTEAIGAGPVVPGPLDEVPGQYTAGISRERINIAAQNYPVTAGGLHYLTNLRTPDGHEVTARTQVWQDGRLLVDNASGYANATMLPPEPHTYRVRAELDLTGVQPLGNTRAVNDWTFTSSADRTGSLPQLSVFLDPAPDHAGVMLPVSFRVGDAGAVTGTKLKSVKVEASYDDGGHWRPAVATKRPGNRFVALVGGPAASYVSLRITASTPDGRSVQQTVIRAYAVKSH